LNGGWKKVSKNRVIIIIVIIVINIIVTIITKIITAIFIRKGRISRIGLYGNESIIVYL